MRTVVAAFVAQLVLISPLAAQQSIGEYTRGMEKRDGYVPLYWDAEQGRLLLEIGRFDEEFLYLTSLATGVGSTQLGLDRGTIMSEAVARFERVGPKVLLVLVNTQFRAIRTDNPALRRSVEESFPTSTIAAFDVLAEESGRVLVDATGHVVADQLGIAERLQNARQGTFSLSRERSTVYLARTKAFPRNTEIEVSLTFTSQTPGALVRQHAPDGSALTVRAHYSLVQLPEAGYAPRRADPRIGVFGVAFMDFSRPLEERYHGRYIIRHRLEKRNPAAARSEPVRPIVYYLDRGIPEPYRSAFREGAMWWNRLFEAAGFTNAFRVEDMPEDMDPMDARYHVIQWVHRSDPGFSIGPEFVDPRTGEIIKAAVRMDSYRSLTDYNIYAGTVPAAAEALAGGLDAWLAGLDPNVSAEAFAMARRRQHAAHEVGHTLGLSHNFVAASYGRASVMDYPAPLIQLRDGRIDLSDAYRDGPGAYDSIAIRYAYTPFPADQEHAGLEAIVREAMARGIKFNADGDNATWSSYPQVTQWVNGSDMLAELSRVMDVRRHLMARFDERAIRPGEPMVMLNYRFVPVYLHHRYNLEAAVKAVGGMEFRYAVRGDTIPPTRMLPAAEQRRALELVLDALEPSELAIPERVLALMAPRAYGVETDEWSFGSAAYPAFDQIGVARLLASTVMNDLFAPRRAARLVAFHARQPDAPSLEEVISRVIARTWGAAPGPQPALRRVVQRAVVDALIGLAADEAASVDARAGAEWGLREIAETIQNADLSDPSAEAHVLLAWADIDRFLSRRDDPTARSRPLPAPPGTPIGKRDG